MPDCIFCKIIEGKIPSSKIYESNTILAFLDISPVNKGHTLVIPKAHHTLMMDVPDDILQDLIIAVKKVTKAIMKATKAGGVNLSLSMHDVAGQTVPHAHFHVIPRHEGDGLRHWPQGKYDEGEMQYYSEKIRANL